MDRDIIERYLLQVGRSFYTTHDFQRSFAFVATSRFGVGFLSIFGASDDITIDTYKPSSSSGDGPLRLALTGPRNYLLLEKGHRQRSGTRIEAVLRKPLLPSQLAKSVSEWCRRVEFPIKFHENGLDTEITSERKEQFIYEVPDVTKGQKACGARLRHPAGGRRR
jgi:molecular chaperone HtpG